MRQLALADAHDQAAVDARATAARYGIAAVTEKRTARLLAPLAAAGYHLLADRAWPGSRRAQVDLFVVGPGGVFIVDTKAWADVSIESERIYRGQDDVTDDLMSLADLGYATEGELADVGLAPGEVHVLAVLAGRALVDERVGPVRVLGERDVLKHIAGHGHRLTPGQVDAVLARSLAYFRQVGAPAPVSVTVVEPVLPTPAMSLDDDALISEEDVEAALLDGLLAAPIEEWMSFLHPTQARVVRRNFNGPARIRGAAGTGKTVVGLHRAAYLARSRPGRVLVTTFVRTLPHVLGNLLTRMAPDVVDRVEFLGVHEFAGRILDERGVPVRVDTTLVDAAWGAAWLAVGMTTPLSGGRVDRTYWRDEVQLVIKGRGITRFEQYADLPRSGRRHRLGSAQRRDVWHLYEAYQRELAGRRVHDFADRILLAAAELERQPLTDRYSAVIVDEAQDLSCVMIRLLHGLVGDRPDGLTLLGDGQQTIYPGGFGLSEAGVSVANRGVVLDINYRNTEEIANFASRLIVDDEFDDIEGSRRVGDRASAIVRHGPEPTCVRCGNSAERAVLAIERVRDVVREVGTAYGDIGMLSLSLAGVRQMERSLAKAGIPFVNLTDYNGASIDAVRLGTVKRAKGLEFKQVLIVDARHEWFSTAPSEQDDVDRERREYRTRELYVAMTRARDGLWIGTI